MSHNKPIVFFDDGCPICEKEIRHYKSIDHRQKLQWIDISKETTLLNPHGVPYDDAMRKLHVVNTHCEIKMGDRWIYSHLAATTQVLFSGKIHRNLSPYKNPKIFLRHFCAVAIPAVTTEVTLR